MRDSLGAGHFPLRQPDTFSGTPFLANCQQTTLFYPDMALWMVMPLRWAFAVDHQHPGRLPGG